MKHATHIALLTLAFVSTGCGRSVPLPQNVTSTPPGQVVGANESGLTTIYIHAEKWPPTLTHAALPLTCAAEETHSQTTVKRDINGRDYCVTMSSEGAAGSVFTEYQYSTEREGHVLTMVFTLRAVQCANYDEPQKTECTNERENFNVDAFADRLIQGVND